MARSTSQVLAALKRIIPWAFHGDGSLLAGIAALFARVEALIDALRAAGTWGGAEDEWLDLHAAGLDMRRADGETDEQLLARMRGYPDMLTCDAVEAAATRALQTVDPDAEAVLLEHWRDGAFCGSAYCGQDRPLQTNAGFTVLMPDVYGDPFDHRHAAVVAAVEGVRAHGARWYLVIDLAPPATP